MVDVFDGDFVDMSPPDNKETNQLLADEKLRICPNGRCRKPGYLTAKHICPECKGPTNPLPRKAIIIH